MFCWSRVWLPKQIPIILGLISVNPLELQGLAPAQDVLNSLVYEQWLLSDLRELETQCLPAEAVSETKFELNGAYALQVIAPDQSELLVKFRLA